VRKSLIVGFGAALALAALLGITSGGFPSQPQFLKVLLGPTTPANLLSCGTPGTAGIFFLGCDTVPIATPVGTTQAGLYAIKSFQDCTNTTGGACIGEFLYNRSTATNAQNFALEIGNNVHQVVYGITGGNFSGSAVTGGPAGEIAFIESPASLPFCFAQAAIANLCINGDSSVTVNAQGSNSKAQVMQIAEAYSGGTGTCTMSTQHPGFGATCTRSGAGIYVLTITGFTNTPSCTATVVGATNLLVSLSSVSNTGVTANTFVANTNVAADNNFGIICAGF